MASNGIVFHQKVVVKVVVKLGKIKPAIPLFKRAAGYFKKSKSSKMRYIAKKQLFIVSMVSVPISSRCV